MPDPLDPTRPALPTWLTVFKAYWLLVTGFNTWGVYRDILAVPTFLGSGPPWTPWIVLLHLCRIVVALFSLAILYYGWLLLFRAAPETREYWDRGLLRYALLQIALVVMGMTQGTWGQYLSQGRFTLNFSVLGYASVGVALTFVWRSYWQTSKRVAATYPAFAAT